MAKKLNRIKEVLDETGQTQSYLAKKLEVSNNAINNLCGNRSQPSLKRLYEIAEILRVDVCRLLNSDSGVKVENGKKHYDPQRTHERLVSILNQFYSAERFKLIPEVISLGEYNTINMDQLLAGVGLLVNANNLAGGDVGDVDLYKLLEVYLKNEETRTKINSLL